MTTKQITRKVMAGLLVLSLMAGNNVSVFACENSNEPQYVENHVDIDLSNINLSVANGDELIMSATNSEGFFQKIDGENNIEKIEDIIEDYPEFEEDLIESVENYTDVAAIGCTEAPLEEVDGQLERVEKQSTGFGINADAALRKGSSNDYYYLTLSTWVTRVEYNKSLKQYKYAGVTRAYWEKTSAIGGKKYPDSGEDFILQSVPKGFTIKSDVCTTLYDDGTRDPKGSYRRVKSKENYVQYAVEDDPFGWKQLREADVTTISYGKSSSNIRRINSYYVHTWSELSLKVSVSLSTSKQVGLSITPTNTKKSWQLNNYVSFNF